MRPLALLAIVLGSTAAGAAGAQTLTTGPKAADGAALALQEAAFAPKSATTAVDPIGAMLDRETYAPGLGPVRWTTGQVQLSRPSAGGPVDSVRVSVGGA